jgi:hypothetical protein
MERLTIIKKNTKKYRNVHLSITTANLRGARRWFLFPVFTKIAETKTLLFFRWVARWIHI